jgi:transcriptional regulator with XRE-family HTH domain
MRQPRLTVSREWGPSVVRPTREGQGLSRSALARRTGVSESGLRNLETGRHCPTPAIVLRVCAELGVPSPLPSAELRLSPGTIDHNTAIKTLRDALREYIATRADPEAFADRLGCQATDRMLAVFEAIGAHDTAKQLIALLPDEDKEPT